MTDTDPVGKFVPVVGANVHTSDEPAPISGARCFEIETSGSIAFEGRYHSFEDATHIYYDALLDGRHNARFSLSLHADNRTATLEYGLLNQHQARIVLPLVYLDQNQWELERRGAWLKPALWGDPIPKEDITQLELTVEAVADEPVRWWQTPIVATAAEPEQLSDPTLLDGPIVDEFGQSTLHEWEGRTVNETELVDRFHSQSDERFETENFEDRDRWGGWAEQSFRSTGFFRIEHDNDRWWFVTPDGHPFWSVGLDVISPGIRARYDGIEDAFSWIPDSEGSLADADSEWKGNPPIDHLRANLIRTFGPERWNDEWGNIVFDRLRQWGFNTVGNWSRWQQASKRSIPYVRPLEIEFETTIFRDFPDVFNDTFENTATSIAAQLEETVDDPAMIGYFLGNEPTYLFADESPAAGMLFATETCVSRRRFSDWLYKQDDNESELADAWNVSDPQDAVTSGQWNQSLTDRARVDCEIFSQIMVDRLYGTLAKKCRKIDPNHLLLGVRPASVPPEWALRGMRHFDVFSINGHYSTVPETFSRIPSATDAPVLIGEFHFGAPDVGLPTPGFQIVKNQAKRGSAYRAYLEYAAAKP